MKAMVIQFSSPEVVAMSSHEPLHRAGIGDCPWGPSVARFDSLQIGRF